MTLTETPSGRFSTPAVAVGPGKAMVTTWLATTDHKRIGFLYLFAAFIGAFVSPRGSMTMALLILFPAWIGLFTAIVPIQIGAFRVALPRFQAMTLWMFVVGLFLVGVARGSGAHIGDDLGGGNINDGSAAVRLALAGFGVSTLSLVLAAAGVLVTIWTQRRPRTNFSELPRFSWAAFLTSSVLLMSLPVVASGLFLRFLDRKFIGATASFAGRPELRAFALVRLHSLSLFGSPLAYALALPAVAVVVELVTARGARRLPRPVPELIRTFMVLASIVSFGGWILSENQVASLHRVASAGYVASVFCIFVAAFYLLPDVTRRASDLSVGSSVES